MEKITAIKMIRMLSGAFINEEASMIKRLGMVCLLARYLENDVEYEFVNEQMEPYGFELEEE